MIHTTLGAVAAAEESLKAVGALKLPVKAAYQVSKLFAAVSAELEHWHKQRLAWVQELGEATDEGTTVVRSAALPDFVTRMNELATVAVELPVAPITLDVFGDTELAVRDVAALSGAGLLVEPTPSADGPHLVDMKKEQRDGERQLHPASPRR